MREKALQKRLSRHPGCQSHEQTTLLRPRHFLISRSWFLSVLLKSGGFSFASLANRLSLLLTISPGHAGDARIKLLRECVITSAEALSLLIYNCRTREKPGFSSILSHSSRSSHYPNLMPAQTVIFNTPEIVFRKLTCQRLSTALIARRSRHIVGVDVRKCSRPRYLSILLTSHPGCSSWTLWVARHHGQRTSCKAASTPRASAARSGASGGRTGSGLGHRPEVSALGYEAS